MIKCEKCGKECGNKGALIIHLKYCGIKKYCQVCGEETKNPKFCSPKCSGTVATKGKKHSLETRNKISISLGGSGDIKTEKRFCKNCNNEVPKDFCNMKCKSEFDDRENTRKWLNDEISGNSRYGTYQPFIKRYLLNKFENKCCKCGWNEVHPITKKVPLHIDHIDGNFTNNRPENVTLLCPNCHSLTPTFGALNIGNGGIELANLRKVRQNRKEFIKGQSPSLVKAPAS